MNDDGPEGGPESGPESGPDGGRPDPGEPHEQVGSVADEAAKLFSALQDWAKESGAGQGSAAASAAAGFGAGLGARIDDLNDHIATGGKDCTYCPVCQVIALVRQTSPEVRTHLSVAASSLLHAAAGLLETPGPRGRSGTPGQTGVQKIDLDDGPEPDDDGEAGPTWDAD